MFLKNFPLLFAIIAIAYGKPEASIKLNRTENAAIRICDEEPDHRDHAKMARYVVHKAGKRV